MSGWRLAAPLVAERHFDGRTLLCHRDRPRSLFGIFARSLASRPDAEVVVDARSRLSYRALDRLAGDAAADLARRGIGRGDRVALLLSNRAEFVVYLLAAARLGAIAVPLGTRQKAPELAYALADSGSAALVTEGEFLSNIPERSLTPALRALIDVDRGAPGAAEPPPVAEVGEEDVAVLLYTSGTTGRPKGAMLTHLNIVHSVTNFCVCLSLGPADRTIMAVPASHVTGLVAILLALIGAGGATVLMHTFKAADFLKLAEAEKLTYSIMVPAQYVLCLMQADFDRYELSSWRIGAYGGAPMAEATIAELARRKPNLLLVNGYGSTETTSPTSLTPPGLGATHAESVGKVVPGGHVRIVDDDGRDVPPGATGELWTSGAMVVPGYWNNPEATRASFHEGYWKSGDIGSLDADGWLRVFDRKKDMINRAGYKVFSAEVESLLLSHPAVAEAAVIGRPDPVLGERVHAVVFAKASIAEAELRAFCAERLADYKVPETIELSPDPLPRNANGKLQKAALRQRLSG